MIVDRSGIDSNTESISKRSKVNLCMPADFKTDTLKEYDKITNFNNDSPVQIRIFETFGALNPEQGIPSARGRMSPALPFVDFSLLSEYIKESHNYGIEFNYLLNGIIPSSQAINPKFISNLLSFVEHLYSIGINTITLTNSSLIRNIRHTFPEIPIVVSVVNGIDSTSGSIWYIEHGVSRINLSERVNRDFRLFDNLLKLPCSFELQLNAKCTLYCPIKWEHFEFLSSLSETNIGSFDRYFTNSCDMIRHLHPWDILRTTFIRPEDIPIYVNHGIHYFKFIGREWCEKANFPRVLSSYFNMNYDGSLYELLDAFRRSNYPYLSNKALNGFIDYFVKEKPDCRTICGVTCNYCRDFFNNLRMNWKPKKSSIKRLEDDSNDFFNTCRSLFKSIWRVI